MVVKQSNITIIYDGDCNLCNFWVNKLKRNKNTAEFHFTPISHITDEQKTLIQFNKYLQIPDSIILIENDMVFVESLAILKISSYLGGWYTILLLGYVIPKYLRDMLYRFIARNRYRWFGRSSCDF